jgi:hypothetical protein
MDLLILPVHCKHLIQPIDVGVASTIKKHFDRHIKEAVGDSQAAFGDLKRPSQGR